MKYRKKPVIIEAEQYLLPGKRIDGVCYEICNQLGKAHIHTLEGVMVIHIGDWVITGVEGEKYPCKPGIFEKTYEKVGELDATSEKRC